MSKTPTDHITEIHKIASEKDVLLIDAVAHYTEYNSLDPYFVADIVRSDKQMYNQLLQEAKTLNLTK